MSERPVLAEAREGVLEITLNRPEARNAVNAAVAEGVAAALDRLDGDDELRAAILTGAGSSFCAGMDLKAFVAGERPYAEGRGFAGHRPAPAREADHRRDRGLRRRGRVRGRARVRPDRGGSRREGRHPGGQARRWSRPPAR